MKAFLLASLLVGALLLAGCTNDTDESADARSGGAGGGGGSSVEGQMTVAPSPGSQGNSTSGGSMRAPSGPASR